MFLQGFKTGSGRVKLYKKHGEKNHLRIGYYVKMAYCLMLKLPWRLITVYSQKDDRLLYITFPICEFIMDFGHKLGMIYGSIKYRALYL